MNDTMTIICLLCGRPIDAASNEITWGDMGEFHKVCFEIVTAQAISVEQAVKMIQDKIYEKTYR